MKEKSQFFLKIAVVFVLLLGIANLAFAQQTSITGKVSSDMEGAMPGVTVIVKGTQNGAVTNADGNYTISANPQTDVLVFSFIGMKTKEVALNGKQTLDVVLDSDVIGLDEVVAVGYGVKTKASLTAAVDKITTEKISSSPVSNASNALVGRAPGLITVQSTGEVGKDASQILIRGIGTTGNANPLIVVDGVPRNSLNEIDVNNIESYSILKDAAAVAPYGMAGANGVILITTKSGKKGKTAINYNGWLGFQNPTNLVEYMNSYEFASTFDKSQEMAGVPVAGRKYSATDLDLYKRSVSGDPSVDKNLYPNPDVKSTLLNSNAPITNHHIDLSGGTDLINFYVGMNYMYQEEQWSTSNLDRIGLVSKMDITPTDKTKVGLSINAWNENILKPQTDSKSIFNGYQTWIPTEPITYTDNNGTELLAANSAGGWVLSDRTNLGRYNTDETKTMSSLYVEQELIKGLTVKGVVSYDWTVMTGKNWTEPPSNYYTLDQSTNPYSFVEVVKLGRPSLGESLQQWREFTYQGIINYRGEKGDHKYGFLGVAEARNTKYRYFAASRGEYQIPIDEIDMGSSVKTYWGTAGNSAETAQAGFVGQINYSYKGKYLVDLVSRYDGHYYFSPGNRWGFFPSAALGWRISEEGFMSSLENLNNLKLRASVGQSGALAGGPNQYSSALAIYGGSYPFGGPTQGIYATKEGNPDITWEKATKYNVGIDFGMWEGLLIGKVDYFFEKRDNMLVNPDASVPTEYGIGLAQINAGKMQNQGIEIELRANKNISEDLNINGGAVFTFARNKILEIFENETTRSNPNRSRTGKPLGTIFGYQAIGIFSESDDKNGDGVINSQDGFPNQMLGGVVTPGSIRFADLYTAEGETVARIDGNDMVNIGHPTIPEIIFGFDLGAQYKGFNLSFLFQGATNSNAVIGGTFVNYFKENHNLTKDNLDSWTPQNQDATYPIVRPNGQTQNDMEGSTFYLIDMTYLRLKNFEFGYTLPKSFIKKASLENAKIYIAATNLLTFDKTRGLLDPEQNNSSVQGANAERGWWQPQNKIVSVGINLTF